MISTCALIYAELTYILSILSLYLTHMKPIKKILLALTIIIVLTGLAIWILTKTIKPSVINDLINKQLSALTAQKSHVDGDITWQLLPRPGINISQVNIGDEKNQANYSLHIDNLILNLQIAPLLRGHFVFDALKIDGMKLTIHSEANDQRALSGPHEPTASMGKVVPDKMPVHVAIKYFLLTRGQIIIYKPHTKITLTGLQVGANQFNVLKDYFPFQVKANVIAVMTDSKVSTTFNYKGRIRLIPSTLTSPRVALQKAGLDGQLILQNLRVNEIELSKITANTITNKGTIILSPLNISLYNGESTGDLSYQFASDKLSINQTATGLNANQLFKDLSGNNLVSGNLDFSIHATSNLQTANWLSNTQGNGHVTIKDGVLSFTDLNKLVRDTTDKIHALLEQKKNEPNATPKLAPFIEAYSQKENTKFQLLSIQYRLLDAQLINDSVLLQTDKLQLKGQGHVNLKDTSINGNLLAKLVTTDNRIDKIQQLLGGTFPLKLSGTFKNPIILPDIQIINPIIVQYLLRNTLEKPVKLIKQHIQTLLTSPESPLPESTH